MNAARAYMRWHRRQLTERPYVTNAITSAVLMLGGDRVAQYLERWDGSGSGSGRDGEDDPAGAGSTGAGQAGGAAGADAVDTHVTARASWTRTGVLTFWSGCVNSPFFTWWYAALPRWWPGRHLVWVTATATLCAPVLNAAFFCFSTAAEHFALHPAPWRHTDALQEEVRERLATRWWDTVVRSTQVWVCVNYVNFTWTPLEYRMLVASAFALAWNVFLSLQQHARPEPGQVASAIDVSVAEYMPARGASTPQAGAAEMASAAHERLLDVTCEAGLATPALRPRHVALSATDAVERQALR